MKRATKVRIYPTVEQRELLDRQFGAVRFVYNKALAIMSHRYRVHGEKLYATKDLKPLLAVAKRSRKYPCSKEPTPQTKKPIQKTKRQRETGESPINCGEVP